MSSRKTKPASYVDSLLAELDAIHTAYAGILAASAIVNVDPNRHGDGGIFFVGAPTWGWSKSDDTLEASRMALLRRIRAWEPRFRLLFPHPTPTVSKRLDEQIGRLLDWLIRDKRDHTVPRRWTRPPR